MLIVPPPPPLLIIGTITEEKQRLMKCLMTTLEVGMFNDYFGGVSL